MFIIKSGTHALTLHSSVLSQSPPTSEAPNSSPILRSSSPILKSSLRARSVYNYRPFFLDAKFTDYYVLQCFVASNIRGAQ